MPSLNAFQILSRKKLVSLSAELVMKDDLFAKKLALLLKDHGINKAELIDILRDNIDNEKHNNIEEKNKQYVYNRFDLFDENLNWRKNLSLTH